MNSFQQPRRRSMDGPIRRAPIRPVQPEAELDIEAVSGTKTPDIPPVAPTTTVATEPVFEYRKRQRDKKWWRWLLIGLGIVVLVLGAWFGYKALSAMNKIIGKSNGAAPALAGDLNLTQLKGEGDGRVNVLMLGIGGEGHEAPNLSDTIMVMSIDPKTKDVAMLSVPRDLYVKYAGKGGSAGKINAANAFGGPELAAKTVQQVIGVPIHYYVLVDFSGFKQAIDAVGGIDVDVPQTLYDTAFPCDNGKNYCPLSIKAGMQHMNGTTALKYARCRHGAPTGNCGDDFGRATRQQEILVALRQKALQASTLTNPVKLTGLIDSVGNHVKTDLQLGEIKKLAELAKDVDTKKISNKVLDTDVQAGLLVGGIDIVPGAGYIEIPKLGLYNYSDIQDFVKNIFVDHYIVEENARIEVQNGSGLAGIAGQVVTSLKAAHYNVADPTNAPETYTKTVIYDYTGGKKPYTINYLERRFGVKAMKASRPSVSPVTGQTGTTTAAAPEIRIILGSDYKTSTTQSR